MAERNDSKQEQKIKQANQEDPGAPAAGDVAGNIGGNAGSQHNDWGHSQVGDGGNAQSDGQAPAQSESLGRQAGSGGNGSGGNIGGVPGSQHNDWGRSPVATDGNRQADAGANAQSAAQSVDTPRQGVIPGEEMGHLQRDGGKGRDGGPAR